MNSIKGKVFIVFILSAICITSLGYYSWFTLNKITGKVRDLSTPDVKDSLFKELSSDIIHLNNTYSSYNTFDSLEILELHRPIIEEIKGTISLIKLEYDPHDTLSHRTLDSIPYLIDVIEKDFLLLQKARRNNSEKFVSKLIKTLNEKINEYQDKDSAYVVEQIQLQLTAQEGGTRKKIEEEEDKSGFNKFLSSIFSKKPKDEEEKEKASADTLKTSAINPSSKVSVDSLAFSKNNEMLRENILEVIVDLYTEEMDKLRKLNKLEKEIHSQNTFLIHEIEKAINEFREAESNNKQKAIGDTIVFTDTFSSVLTNVILLFTILSILLLFMVLKDLNRSRFYQMQLMAQRENAEKAAEAKQSFLATMSHELRTPLTSIIGYADLLENKDDNIKAIKSSSEHLLKVANEVLDLAKFESGKIEIHQQPVHLNQLLEDIRLNFEVLIKRKNLRGVFEIPQEDIFVKTDDYRLHQILYNLMHNALKFTQEGYIRMAAKVQQQDNSKIKLDIEVEDSGAGIAQNEQNMIFEDYQQAGIHKNGKQGTGLGLGIVKKVVHLMGGHIQLKSELGKGSTFSVSFTLETAEKFNFSDHEQDSVQSFTDTNIYVVDDDPLITKLYRNTFEPLGAKVLTCTNPEEALVHLKAHCYDLVITDINMPGLHGTELLQKLEKEGARPAKMICATADILLSEEDKKVLQKFDAILYKPIRKKDLIQKVSEVLRVENDPKNISEETKPHEKREHGLHFDLSEIEEYAMGDKDLLKELLLDLYQNNVFEIEEAFQNLKAEKFEELASGIHKLASRFNQIKVKAPVSVKDLEHKLQTNTNISSDDIKKLLSFWKNVNSEIGQKHQLLRR